eukprot:CAMPEP_0117440240 /NCGR_PEP_ID=MMETSP0759-20121206/2981_1 /TAXON_ID=63605 /ORGANISM="Percolomonas cosmopolitus, Strain WS" /LENGTH=222 /DNA_ID=CAMNT_0005231985 /DNA_START=1 /DNA_END=666 /DNA_ORIENTATION=+
MTSPTSQEQQSAIHSETSQSPPATSTENNVTKGGISDKDANSFAKDIHEKDGKSSGDNAANRNRQSNSSNGPRRQQVSNNKRGGRGRHHGGADSRSAHGSGGHRQESKVESRDTRTVSMRDDAPPKDILSPELKSQFEALKTEALGLRGPMSDLLDWWRREKHNNYDYHRIDQGAASSEEKQANTSKYRCPGCQLLYCSLLCCKKHKDIFTCSGERDPTEFS